MSDWHEQAFRGAIGNRAQRRTLWRYVAVTLGAAGIGALGNDDGGTAKKKRKNKKKGSGTAPAPTPTPAPTKQCRSPYFTCDGQCRMIPACCDSIPATSCAKRHEGEPGNWVCCTERGFGCYDLANDDLNCGECYTQCPQGKHCLDGKCLS